MAEKKIIWTQKTASGSDTLYPRTVADNVVYKSGTVADFLDDVSASVAGEFVKKTGDTVTGNITFTSESGYQELLLSAGYIQIRPKGGQGAFQTFSSNGISNGLIDAAFPTQSGTLAVKEDITKQAVGLGNVQNVDTTNAANITSGTIPRARLPLASATENGAMSADDKKNLDTVMGIIGNEAGDADNFVNTVRELLDVFENYPEGANIYGILSGKADTSDLANYVKKSGDTMTGSLMVGTSDESVTINQNIISVYSEGTNFYYGAGFVRDKATSSNIVFPNKGGTFALLDDIPTALPPNGTAGGDLTGTYPNPTIGSKKVTAAKIADATITATQLADGAVSAAKLASNAVTTVKILDGNVTNAKLDTTGVTAGTYSAITVNAQGRATAGAQLFTIGTSSTIPDSVPTNGFYLQEVA